MEWPVLRLQMYLQTEPQNRPKKKQSHKVGCARQTMVTIVRPSIEMGSVREWGPEFRSPD